MTVRRNGKWAQVSGSRGKWTVARGFRGDFRASIVNTTRTRLHATVIARNWVSA